MYCMKGGAYLCRTGKLLELLCCKTFLGNATVLEKALQLAPLSFVLFAGPATLSHHYSGCSRTSSFAGQRRVSLANVFYFCLSVLNDAQTDFPLFTNEMSI